MKNVKTEIVEMLESANANWEVVKRPLSFKLDGERHKTSFFGAVRNDTGVCFGTCKERYEVFQNSEMAELAFRVQEETGYNAANMKVYGHGERISLDLMGKDEVLEYPQKGDVMQKSIRLTNSHDGSGSLRLALGSLVLSCTNGMTRWVNDRQTSIRHTTNMRDMVEQALKGFGLLKAQEEQFVADVNRMIGTPVNEAHVTQMMNQVLEIDLDNIVRTEAGEWSSQEYSTQKVKKAYTLKDSIKEEIAYKGANVWGLLNGITHFTTHKGGRDKTREASKVFGDLMRMDAQAWDIANAMVHN